MRSEEPAAEAGKAEGAGWTALLIPRQLDRIGSDAYDGIEGTSHPTSNGKATSKFKPLFWTMWLKLYLRMAYPHMRNDSMQRV